MPSRLYQEEIDRILEPQDVSYGLNQIREEINKAPGEIDLFTLLTVVERVGRTRYGDTPQIKQLFSDIGERLKPEIVSLYPGFREALESGPLKGKYDLAIKSLGGDKFPELKRFFPLMIDLSVEPRNQWVTDHLAQIRLEGDLDKKIALYRELLNTEAARGVGMFHLHEIEEDRDLLSNRDNPQVLNLLGQINRLRGAHDEATRLSNKAVENQGATPVRSGDNNKVPNIQPNPTVEALKRSQDLMTQLAKLRGTAEALDVPMPDPPSDDDEIAKKISDLKLKADILDRRAGRVSEQADILAHDLDQMSELDPDG